MFSKHFTLTKRNLGILLLMGGIVGFLGILSIDFLNPGRQGGIGPAQRIGLGMMAAVALVGLTLIPIGNDPA